jgi:hypothetical protein
MSGGVRGRTADPSSLLDQLGVRQARYFGRQKTLFQALMAATVANLTLVASKTGEMGASMPQLFLRLRDWHPIRAMVNHVQAFRAKFHQGFTLHGPSIRPIWKPGFRLSL